MIKGVIFDMDGLMFDTERLSTEGWLNWASSAGIELEMTFVNSFKGRTREYSSSLFKQKFGDKFDYDSARAARTRYMNDYIEKNGMPVKKGLYELLNFLHSNNIPCALATSTKRVLAEKYLETADVKKYFSAVIYGDMVERGKPYPDIFIAAAKEIGAELESCVVLEDSPAGITAAFNGGAKAVAVPDMVPLDSNVLSKLSYCVSNLELVIGLIEENLL